MDMFKYLIVGSLLLSGCANQHGSTETLTPVSVVQESERKPAAEPVQEVESPPLLPNVELTEELLYELILSEIANQRGHKALAVETSSDAALKTHDPRLARRAAQLALEQGDMNASVDAFRFWQETEPNSILATRMLSSLLLRGGRLEEARVELVKVLETESSNAGLIYMQIYPMLVPYPDKPVALKLMRDLAALNPGVAEAHWVVAQLASEAGDEPLALKEVREARVLKPEWELPVSLESRLLRVKEPQQSLGILQRYLTVNPEASRIRLQYARSLLEQKQYQPAREQFQRLSQESPENVELAFAVALISLQLNDYASAEDMLRKSLDKGGKSRNDVEYFLGQLSEAKENEDEALAHYREVNDGEYLFTAQTRIIYLLNKRGKKDEARQFLQQIKVDTNQQRVQLVLMEAQLLREASQFAEAYRVLQLGLEKLPNHADLLYEAAMMADKLGHIEASERYLRKLIKVKPDNAHAYNALGYGFLVRNVRIAEGLALVVKAFELAPDDVAIMDSVGWGYFRSGKLKESLDMLRRAYKANQDPEIAAHLGEVLWVHGDKDEARVLLQDSLKANPGNEILETLMKRLMP